MALFDASFVQVVLGLSALGCLLVLLGAISVVDWRTRRIPNMLIGQLLLLRSVIFLFDLCLGQDSIALDSLLRSLMVAFGAGGFLFACKLVAEHLTKKECLGLGDVKLVGAGYTFLSLDQAMVALVLACLAGSVLALFFRITRKDPTFPFGPALCLGIVGGIFA